MTFKVPVSQTSDALCDRIGGNGQPKTPQENTENGKTEGDPRKREGTPMPRKVWADIPGSSKTLCDPRNHCGIRKFRRHWGIRTHIWELRTEFENPRGPTGAHQITQFTEITKRGHEYHFGTPGELGKFNTSPIWKPSRAMVLQCPIYVFKGAAN